MSAIVKRNPDGTAVVDHPVEEARGRLTVLTDLLPEESKSGIVEAIEFVTADGKFHVRDELWTFGDGDRVWRLRVEPIDGADDGDGTVMQSLVQEVAQLRRELAQLGAKA